MNKISSSNSPNSIILGIDPGYARIGFAVIEKTKSGEVLLHSECFETSIKTKSHQRLLLIGERVAQTIKKYNPEKVAVESLLWSKNKKTALQVAEARGVILFQIAKENKTLVELNPNQIKLAVTGYGKSDKKQVISMIPRLIKMGASPKNKRLDDEYDAIAIALTCSALQISTNLR